MCYIAVKRKHPEYQTEGLCSVLFCRLNSIVLEHILLITGDLWPTKGPQSHKTIFCRNRVPIEYVHFTGHKLPICDCYHNEMLSIYVRLIDKICKTVGQASDSMKART